MKQKQKISACAKHSYKEALKIILVLWCTSFLHKVRSQRVSTAGRVWAIKRLVCSIWAMTRLVQGANPKIWRNLQQMRISINKIKIFKYFVIHSPFLSVVEDRRKWNKNEKWKLKSSSIWKKKHVITDGAQILQKALTCSFRCCLFHSILFLRYILVPHLKLLFDYILCD